LIGNKIGCECWISCSVDGIRLRVDCVDCVVIVVVCWQSGSSVSIVDKIGGRDVSTIIKVFVLGVSIGVGVVGSSCECISRSSKGDFRC
jgi:hypothetical protein